MSRAERSFACAESRSAWAWACRLLGVVVLRPGRVAVGEELALPLLLGAALLDECKCCGNIGLGGRHGVPLVLVVQPREQVAGGDPLPDIDGALNDLARHAEPQVAFMAGLDLTGQRGRPVECRFLHLDGADERRLGRRRCRLLAAQERDAGEDRHSCGAEYSVEILHGGHFSSGAAFREF